jgi:phenylacetate-CoA ligase
MTTPGPAVTRFVASLEESQYLPQERMQAYQRRLLANLLRHARTETGFYRDRLSPAFRADGSVDWDRWTELPILTRAEAQANFSGLVARSLPPAAGKAIEETTSGSTGQPLRYLETDLQNMASACCSERFFGWHKLDPGRRTARIRYANPGAAEYPDGRTTMGWRYGHPESIALDLSIAAPAEKQIEWLLRMKPAYLTSYPSNLREVAHAGREAGVRLPLDAVLSYGEMLTADMRAAIREYFGTEPIDRYGTGETGYIAGTCPHSGKLHVASEVVLLEVVDDAGDPVPPGAEGRIVLTPLYGIAMPMIRYDIGDRGALSAEPCGCGRMLPLLDGLYGRVRNVFRFSDGTSVWPLLFSVEMLEFVSFRQFQVVQCTPTEVEFRYVPRDRGSTPDHAGLTAYMRARLHPSVTVTLSAVETIGRSTGGKFEDYVSLVGSNGTLS